MPEKKPDGSAAPDWIDPDDAPELDEAFFAAADTFVDDQFVKRGRGRPPTGQAKALVSLRLDPAVLDALRRSGPGWQSRVNLILRDAMGLAPPGTLARKPVPAA